MRKFFYFCIAGGVGFAVDIGVLVFFLHFDLLNEFIARIFSIGAALLSTWPINRNFTFQKGNRSVASEGFRYGSVGISSNLLNYAIYVSLLFVFSDSLRPTFAVAISSALATCWAYFGYSRFVYGAPKDKAPTTHEGKAQ